MYRILPFLEERTKTKDGDVTLNPKNVSVLDLQIHTTLKYVDMGTFMNLKLLLIALYSHAN